MPRPRTTDRVVVPYLSGVVEPLESTATTIPQHFGRLFVQSNANTPSIPLRNSAFRRAGKWGYASRNRLRSLSGQARYRCSPGLKCARIAGALMKAYSPSQEMLARLGVFIQLGDFVCPVPLIGPDSRRSTSSGRRKRQSAPGPIAPTKAS
jgi:hypothetical protein